MDRALAGLVTAGRFDRSLERHRKFSSNCSSQGVGSPVRSLRTFATVGAC